MPDRTRQVTDGAAPRSGREEVAVLRLAAADEVGIALRDLEPGEPLRPFDGTATTAVPFGHKVALTSLADGAVIHRMGQPIGLARGGVSRGAHVHLHNMGFGASMAGRA